MFTFLALQGGVSFAYDVQGLSLEEKVGQLLLVHFLGEEGNGDAKKLICDVKVGGIIYFSWANSLSSPSQVQSLSRDLQILAQSNPSSIPLWIAVDQEGGVVASLKEGFTPFAGNKALAMTGDTSLAREVACAIGTELRSVGINMNFAPVVDVNVHPRNPAIGLRSFGEDAKTVIRFGKAMIEGYHEAHVLTTLKHFPGHGDVWVDSHDDLPLVSKSQKELEEVELLPFQSLASFSDAVMTAHILVPSLDEKKCATFSSTILGYLRREIGFSGLIISDSLIMKAVLSGGISVEEAAIRALDAGCDLLILGGKLFHSCEQCELLVSDVERVHRAIVQAVQQGRLSKETIERAVTRSLQKKEQYFASLQTPVVVDAHLHQSLAKTVASRSIRYALRRPFVLEGKKMAFFAPKILRKEWDQIFPHEDGIFYSLDPLKEEIEKSKALASMADILFVCSYNAWKHPEQVLWMQSLMQLEKPVVLWVARDPIDADLFPEADATMLLYSPTGFSLQAAKELLLSVDGQSPSF